MNIIVISLLRAPDRRYRMCNQLAPFNTEVVENVVIMDAVDGDELSAEELNKKILFGYRNGEKFKPGEIGCTMSHIKALKIAKENKWPWVLILEDDVIIARDLPKRTKFLFKILPKDWEHVYVSGIPHIDYYPNMSIANVIPSPKVECTHSMVIRDTAYDKIINKLETFGTTTDDLYNDMIAKSELKSYTLFPFVSYPKDEYTYIWEHNITREHMSKRFYKERL